MPELGPGGITAEAVSANGLELFVRRLGDPALPMLIVVHGGPTWDHSYLLPAVAGLADLAHVVFFDLRGCGRSARTAPVGDLPGAALQPDLLADDVAALMTFPVSLARRLHVALPASTLVEVPDAAHMAHFDNPEAWLAGIRTFLQSRNGRR